METTRRFAVLLFVSLAFRSHAALGWVNIPRDHPLIQYYGRMPLHVGAIPIYEAYWTSWPGAYIRASFQGTAIRINIKQMDDTTHYSVVVDGKEYAASERVFTVSNLPDGAHTILVTNHLDCPFVFGSFDLEAGKTLLPLPDPVRKMEIIGDSIAAGYNNGGGNPAPNGDNVFYSFGALIARRYGADYYITANSGAGMIRKENALPDKYLRVVSYDDRPDVLPWKPALWVPDAILIYLATNDQMADSADRLIAYRSAYIAFISRLRSYYPKAKIVCLFFPTILMRAETEFKSEIQNAVKHHNTVLKDGHVYFVGVDPQLKDNSDYVNRHPNKPGHQKIADSLIPPLDKALGWGPASKAGGRPAAPGR